MSKKSNLLDDAKDYYNRGVAKLKLGDYEDAIADYDQAIALNPDDADAYYNRGIAKRGLGDHDSAIADFDQGIELKPDDGEAYFLRGVPSSSWTTYAAP